jgi:hypothetical protein
MKKSIWKRKGYFWITLVLFILALGAHWIYGWSAYKQDELQHHSIPQFSSYYVVAMRDTMENWQSEFLQLIWQVTGLSFLWYTGSPASKEGDDRKEAKLDYIIKQLDPEKGKDVLADLEKKYPKK